MNSKAKCCKSEHCNANRSQAVRTGSKRLTIFLSAGQVRPMNTGQRIYLHPDTDRVCD